MVINSATDSKSTHRIMEDLMPPNVYFRLNPFITEGYLNEYRSDKLTKYQKVHPLSSPFSLDPPYPYLYPYSHLIWFFDLLPMVFHLLPQSTPAPGTFFFRFFFI